VRARASHSLSLVLGGLASLTGIAACGLTADWTGIQGGSRDGGAPAELDANAPDVPDGQAPPDAPSASDAQPTPDAAGGFCATLTTPVAFCSDFDEGGPVNAGWDTIDVYNTADTVTLGSTSFSPPSSFSSSLFDLLDPPLSARLVKELSTTATTVHMDFELLLSAAPTSGTLELAALHENVNGATYGVFFEEVNGILQIAVRLENQYNAPGPWTFGPPPASTAWTRFVIDIDVADSGSIVVREGGQVVVSATKVQTSTDDRNAMFVELGFYDNGSAAAQASFDNVILDWQ
jgi:hypothetical protein